MCVREEWSTVMRLRAPVAMRFTISSAWALLPDKCRCKLFGLLVGQEVCGRCVVSIAGPLSPLPRSHLEERRLHVLLACCSD